MNKSLHLAVICVETTLCGQAMASDWCKFSADKPAVTLDAAGARNIVIGAGAGDLKVRGVSGQASVIASGRACASSEKLLGEIQLETRREGDTVYVKTMLPDTDNVGVFFNHYATLDLTVSVPSTVAIRLEDSSGDTELKDVQSAVVADGSGDLEISNVTGDLEVTDSSGDIDIRKVGGSLSVKDSSGDMEIEDVQGNVLIPVDSSGDIRIAQVTGGVHIVNDSSGEIVINHVRQDVAIDSDSSGDISVDDIGGNFTVGNDGSGDIHHGKVAGQVSLPPGK
jgi:DUF4097 and DUF4098 domain-containing protein YvlB